jgi:hypothetical protein
VFWEPLIALEHILPVEDHRIGRKLALIHRLNRRSLPGLRIGSVDALGRATLLPGADIVRFGTHLLFSLPARVVAVLTKKPDVICAFTSLKNSSWTSRTFRKNLFCVSGKIGSLG